MGCVSRAGPEARAPGAGGGGGSPPGSGWSCRLGPRLRAATLAAGEAAGRWQPRVLVPVGAGCGAARRGEAVRGCGAAGPRCQGRSPEACGGLGVRSSAAEGPARTPQAFRVALHRGLCVCM